MKLGNKTNIWFAEQLFFLQGLKGQPNTTKTSSLVLWIYTCIKFCSCSLWSPSTWQMRIVNPSLFIWNNSLSCLNLFQPMFIPGWSLTQPWTIVDYLTLKKAIKFSNSDIKGAVSLLSSLSSLILGITDSFSQLKKKYPPAPSDNPLHWPDPTGFLQLIFILTMLEGQLPLFQQVLALESIAYDLSISKMVSHSQLVMLGSNSWRI